MNIEQWPTQCALYVFAVCVVQQQHRGRSLAWIVEARSMRPRCLYACIRSLHVLCLSRYLPRGFTREAGIRIVTLHGTKLSRV